MSLIRPYRLVFGIVVALAALAAFASPAPAKDANKRNCIRGPQGCKIGVENLECGAGGGQTGWHCKSTWTNKCLCFSYGTSKSGWWFSCSTDWQTQPSGPLVANSVVTLQALPTAGNRIIVWELTDPAPDSVSAEVHNALNDMTGQVHLRLLNGPPDSIPVQIELIQLSLTSFNFRGGPTGLNTISLGTTSPVLGYFDTAQQLLDFNEAVACTLRNAQFPSGQLIDIRPRAVPGLPGRYLFDLSATLWLDDLTPVPDARLATPGIVVSPNPSREGVTVLLTLPSAMGITLDVFDVSGRFMKRLAQESLPEGARSVEWDARDASGREVSPGIYFVQARSGSGFQACERFTVLR